MLIFLRKIFNMEDFIIVVFNFLGKDYEIYFFGVLLEDGEYEVILDSNEKKFGGFY